MESIRATAALVCSALLVWIGLLLAHTPASAAPLCPAQDIGGREFRGISGTSDGNVIAVGKDGAILEWDGTACSGVASGTSRDFNDVEAVASTAFAVGQDGVTLQLAGGSWTSHTGFTNKDLRGVWAASASEAYAVGDDGTIYSFDGATWTDRKRDAGIGKDDLTEIWGDAFSVYAVSTEGRLFHFNRLAGTWSDPDSTCKVGRGFQDIRGDGAGSLYLVRRRDVYVHDGTSCVSVASSAEILRGLHGSAQSAHIAAVGKNGALLEFGGGSWSESRSREGLELKDVWVSPAGNAYYAGKSTLSVTGVNDASAATR